MGSLDLSLALHVLFPNVTLLVPTATLWDGLGRPPFSIWIKRGSVVLKHLQGHTAGRQDSGDSHPHTPEISAV